MIPIGDDVPTKSFPFVTVALIVVNVIVFAYELWLGPAISGFVDTHGVIPNNLSLAAVQYHPSGVLNRFVSSLFIHGGWLHLGGNMLYLWVFGDNVEDKLGHSRYLLFYLMAGVVAMLAHVFSAPESTQTAIGASGAIAGVLGAYLVMFPRARVFIVIPLFLFFPVIAIPAVVALGFWFFEQLFSGVGAVTEPTAALNVAWWAHIGGFVAGMLMVKLFTKRQQRYLYARY